MYSPELNSPTCAPGSQTCWQAANQVEFAVNSGFRKVDPTRSNQQIGLHLGDKRIADSSFTDCTKSTSRVSSTLWDGTEEEELPFSDLQKSTEKVLKKEMKKQKIKRKQYSDSRNSSSDKFRNMILKGQNFEKKPSSAFSIFAAKSDCKLPFDEQSLSCKIQKSSQEGLANSIPRKMVHSQSASAPSALQASATSSLNGEGSRNFQSSKTAFEKIELLGNNGNVAKIQIQTLESDSSIDGSCYFVGDLIEEYSLSKQKKCKRSKLPKMNFLKNMMILSESCQIPIQDQKPKSEDIAQINLERRPEDYGKKTLMVDLDDTLIFTEKPVAIDEMAVECEDEHYISQGESKCRKLIVRPHAREFLARMSQHFEVIIFTAATKNYAEQIRKILDPNECYVAHLLHREHCFNPNSDTEVDESAAKLPFVKDLRKIDRDLDQTVLLDNSIYCFWYQIDNGIPITSYNKRQQNDTELLKVESYLMGLLKERDVRVKNREAFKLSRFEEFIECETLIEELYLAEDL